MIYITFISRFILKRPSHLIVGPNWFRDSRIYKLFNIELVHKVANIITI